MMLLLVKCCEILRACNRVSLTAVERILRTVGAIKQAIQRKICAKIDFSTHIRYMKRLQMSMVFYKEKKERKIPVCRGAPTGKLAPTQGNGLFCPPVRPVSFMHQSNSGLTGSLNPHNLSCHSEPVRTLAWESRVRTTVLEIATPVTSVTGVAMTCYMLQPQKPEFANNFKFLV